MSQWSNYFYTAIVISLRIRNSNLKEVGSDLSCSGHFTDKITFHPYFYIKDIVDVIIVKSALLVINLSEPDICQTHIILLMQIP